MSAIAPAAAAVTDSRLGVMKLPARFWTWPTAILLMMA
jgi:hypothetical protein